MDYWGPGSSRWTADQLSLTENMGQVYIGALPILAILCFGLTRGLAWARDVRYFTIMTIFMLLFALGRYTPFFHVAYDLMPGVKLFRRPADATFILGSMAAIVAGYLVHRFMTDTIPAATRRQRMTEIVLLGGACVCACAIAASAHRLDVLTKPMLTALLCLATSLAVLALARRLPRQSAIGATALMTTLMIGDLSFNNGPNPSTGLPPENYDVLRPNCAIPTIRFLKARLKEEPPHSPRRDRIEFTGLGFEWPNASLVHGFDHVLGYNPLRLAGVSDGVGAGDTIAEPGQRIFTPLFPSYRSMLSDMLGLRYIATRDPVGQIDHRYKPGDLRLLAHTKEAYIYENPRALPRVLFATSAKAADFEALIKTGQWPDFDPRTTVLLEADALEGADSANEAAKPTLVAASAAGPIPAMTLVPTPSRPSPKGPAIATPAPPASSLAINKYENTEVEIAVETDHAGYLVLNDVWHPWWVVEVDGKLQPILKANVLFRAVEVPQGRHTVRFEFRPFGGALRELEERMMGTEN